MDLSRSGLSSTVPQCAIFYSVVFFKVYLVIFLLTFKSWYILCLFSLPKRFFWGGSEECVSLVHFIMTNINTKQSLQVLPCSGPALPRPLLTTFVFMFQIQQQHQLLWMTMNLNVSVNNKFPFLCSYVTSVCSCWTINKTEWTLT